MDDSAAILDYASPRKRGRLRLPAVSRLAVAFEGDRVTVEESLAGQTGAAAAALVFGLITTAAAASAAVACGYDFRHHHWFHDWQPALVPALLAAAEFGLMVAVVQQTWRRTVLTAEYDDLRLAFLSPLHRRRYRWTGNDIADVVVVNVANADTGMPLGEVLITRVGGGDVRLFTDHGALCLGGIARAAHDMLRNGHADPLPKAAPSGRSGRLSTASEPLDVAPQAEQTTGRLVGVHRALRDRRAGRTAAGFTMDLPRSDGE